MPNRVPVLGMVICMETMHCCIMQKLMRHENICSVSHLDRNVLKYSQRPCRDDSVEHAVSVCEIEHVVLVHAATVPNRSNCPESDHDTSCMYSGSGECYCGGCPIERKQQWGNTRTGGMVTRVRTREGETELHIGLKSTRRRHKEDSWRLEGVIRWKQKLPMVHAPLIGRSNSSIYHKVPF